jgi:hypothetical protein
MLSPHDTRAPLPGAALPVVVLVVVRVVSAIAP